MASTAGSTAVDTQVSGPQNGGISQRFSDFCTFLYNSEEGKVLGRTGKSWGLTCTEQNFVTKAGAQRVAAEKGVILVAPDTSPPSGHNQHMGGHGALICALKNPGKFKSEYDATELAKQYKGPELNILVDQGQADNFYTEGQLLPDNLSAACAENNVPITLRIQEEFIWDFKFDHSYLKTVNQEAMSSSSVTVAPRHRTAQSPPPGQKSAGQSKSTETVLLRNPLPKYSFDQKPKKKSTAEKADRTEKKDSEHVIVKTSEQLTGKASLRDVKNETDLQDSFRIGKLVNSFPQQPVKTETTTDNPRTESNGNGNASSIKDKPVNKVCPLSKNSAKSLTHSVSDSLLGLQTNQPLIPLSTSSQNTQTLSSGNKTVIPLPVHEESHMLTESANHVHSETSPDEEGSFTELGTEINQSSAGVQACYRCSEKVNHLQEEKQMLKNQLEVQLQVNQELKKLLVASVGEDLQHRVERLTRVMSDEVAASKAFYATQLHECQIAIEKLLNERHQLRANLYDTYRGLQQVQEAFDPFNSHNCGPRLLAGGNNIQLASTNQHLTEAIKYRLLPSHVTSTINSNMDTDWHDYLTQAESHAKQLLSREMRPEDFRYLTTQTYQLQAPTGCAVDRFHPCTNFDNLTMNVCSCRV
ncbi:ESTD-like protein [Mya arenaria]|uniref:ESTD-like protein n=1 Tax=Mya arenaria TaxID=6604 RepID=A0ABY7G6R7_MYAAR|nr:ESTD-like protein [Mya arenaria]